MGATGKRLRSQVVETNGRALVDALLGVAGDRHVCLEEGTQSEWLYEVLKPHVTDVVVTIPSKKQGPKDDLRDAWMLAEELRKGSVERRVYKAPPKLGGLRAAVRGYGIVTQDIVRTKNRIKAIYRSRGVATNASVYDPEHRARWEKKLPVTTRRLSALLGVQLDGLVEVQKEMQLWLREEGKKHPIIKLLSTAPGMGEIRTAQLVAVVISPARFRTTRKFWTYCGLGLLNHSSSDWEKTPTGWVRVNVKQTRGLSRRRNPLLKAVFKGAATTVLQQLRDHPLSEAYNRLLENGTKPNLAKLTVARRIASAVLAMWKNQEAYDPGKQSLTEPAQEV
jgi:transposase